MSTVTLQADILEVDVPFIERILKSLKAKRIKIQKQEKDPTEMTREEFFAMVDKARNSQEIKIGREEMRKRLLGR